MEKLLSVIVAVYNVKPYIEQCIDSICGQTYSNMEIILVDDGSMDGSAKSATPLQEKITESTSFIRKTKA